MKILRRIIFFLFTVIYLTCCPLIILYILGRAYNPATKEVMKTGLIYLSSTPSNATVYLNDNLFSEKTPTTIRELPKGNYFIKLLAENYQPFIKEVTVQEGKALTLDHLLLIPNEWKKETYSAAPFEDLIPLTGTPFVLVRQGPLVKDVFFLKLSKGFEETLYTEALNSSKETALKPLIPEASPFSEAKFLNIFTVEGSAGVVCHISSDQQESFLWVKIETNEPQVVDITALFPEKPEKILWDHDDDKNLFVLQTHFINRLNIPEKALFPKIIKDARSYTIFNNEIYALANDATLHRWDYKGEELETPGYTSALLTLMNKNSEEEIFIAKKNIILFLEKNGRLLINQYPYQIAATDIKGLNWDEKHKKILFWTKDQFGSLDLRFTEPDPNFSNETTSLKWITSERKDIRQAFWVFEESHILFTDSEKIYLLEAETSGTPAIAEIAQIKKGSQIYYSQLSGKVYYLEATTSQLVSVEIVSPRPIIPEAVSTEINKPGKQEKP
jgi:hypothetical protein